MILQPNKYPEPSKRKKYGARKVTWDHKHKTEKVYNYEFESASQLLEDFQDAVDQLLKQFEGDIVAHKTIKIGIISRERYRKRTIAIAKGEYKPKRGEPKVWFESVQSMAQVLSNENQELLRIINEREPKSLKELELLSG